ncbi:MAG: hypothetical protein ABI743_04885 [bacterium]
MVRSLTNAPIPKDLPNPRGFRPVVLPDVEFHPDPATLAAPSDAEAWPSATTFEQRIPMLDGITLRARLWVPEGPPAPFVVLLHMWGMDADSWDRRAPGFLDDLGAMGYAWCALDLRWHGQSGGEPHCAVFADWVEAKKLAMDQGRAQHLESLARQGPPLGANVQFLHDLAIVVNYLKQSGRVDPSRWALIGASVGANAGWVASSLYDARTHILVSPWFPSPGWSLMGREVPDFAPRDCLFVADHAEAPDSRLMAARTAGTVEVYEASEVAEHGVGLLRQGPVARRVLEWLCLALQASHTA